MNARPTINRDLDSKSILIETEADKIRGKDERRCLQME